MVVKPYSNQDEDPENPYGKAGAGSDSISADPNDGSPSKTPKPYTPPDTTQPATKTDDTPPVRTFAQMEGDGQARPPAPVSQPAIQAMITPPIGDANPPQIPDDLGSVQPPGPPQMKLPDGMVQPPGPPQIATETMRPDQPEDLWGGHDQQQVTPPAGDANPPEDLWGGHDQQQVGPPQIANETRMVGDAPPSSATDAILPLLTGKATGTAAPSALQDATTKATLDQLSNPNPYNSDEVMREFKDLGAGIDADYDTRQRGLSDDFARRGLYGSVGKDFASGRASDTELGRRSAKEQLASSLATAQAQSSAAARAQAIAQGQTGTQQETGNQQDWLKTLFGYGDDAFNHDLQTAQFQQGQNQDEQDYILKLLEAGYGA